MAFWDTVLRVPFWKISTTKRPPSSGGMGSRFMMPSETEIMAMNSSASTRPAWK